MLIGYLIGIVVVFLLIKNDPRVRSPFISSLFWPIAIPFLALSVFVFSSVVVSKGVKQIDTSKIKKFLINLALYSFTLFIYAKT